MIRQLIIVLFASYMVCMAADDAAKAGKIGAILDQICSKRTPGSTDNRIEKDKAPNNDDEQNVEEDTENVAEQKFNSNTNLNQNSNRKMYYAINRRFIADESPEGSDENGNHNTNVNINTKHRTRVVVPQRRAIADEPNRDLHRRMMNGLRRKLPRY